MAAIALNARFFSHVPTGMQRYGIEMAKRFSNELEIVRPGAALRGTEGHLWEQLYLPAAAYGRLLWSPNNTGPIAVSRQVCTFHDIIPIDRPDWFNPRFSAWYKWLLPKLAKRVQHIIAVSEFTKQRVVEKLGVPASKISVVANGVDSAFHPMALAEIDQTLLDLEIPSPRYLLCVGSLEPRKNLPRLLEAWRTIAPSLPEDVHLVITGQKRGTLVFADVQIQVPARVHFTGYVKQEQLPALYAGSMGLVYPSLYEGFGLPPLEAMACGTAVITSSNTSLPEVVGDAGILVDPESVQSIGEGMKRLVLNSALREDLRGRGLERAREFTWDRCASETRAVLSAFV